MCLRLSLRCSSFLFILSSFFFSTLVISTSLSSTLLIYSSDSCNLLLFPSSEFFILVIEFWISACLTFKSIYLLNSSFNLAILDSSVLVFFLLFFCLFVCFLQEIIFIMIILVFFMKAANLSSSLSCFSGVLYSSLIFLLFSAFSFCVAFPLVPFCRIQGCTLSCFWYLPLVGEVDRGACCMLPDGRDWCLPICPFDGWGFVSGSD